MLLEYFSHICQALSQHDEIPASNTATKKDTACDFIAELVFVCSTGACEVTFVDFGKPIAVSCRSSSDLKAFASILSSVVEVYVKTP